MRQVFEAAAAAAAPMDHCRKHPDADDAEVLRHVRMATADTLVGDVVDAAEAIDPYGAVTRNAGPYVNIVAVAVARVGGWAWRGLDYGVDSAYAAWKRLSPF